MRLRAENLWHSKHYDGIKGAGSYSIWQYTESAQVKGIPKPVDMCRFNPKYSIDDIKQSNYNR